MTLLSTAYLPPAEYFSQIISSDELLIEREENYSKQTYRNRCYILSPGGPMPLSVPVLLGSFHKTAIRDIRIDYTKRWQQVHLGALKVSYTASPYYLYYHEDLEKIILYGHTFLLDLNMELLMTLLKMLKISIKVNYTSDFKTVTDQNKDTRYSISPKKRSDYQTRDYLHVFNYAAGFHSGLSIVDLLFNTGPDAAEYL